MNREETIFEQALGFDSPAAREAYLREACAGNEPLFQSLQGLLRVHDRAGKFMDPLPPTAGGDADPSLAALLGTGSAPVTEKPGDRIGRYKLLEKIGEGGCGVVYMAEQEEPVRRRVALKVIKLGMDTKSVIARFEAERQALALMDHPNIAKIFDAGITGQRSEVGVQRSEAGADDPLASVLCHPTSGSGRPYFVMELVRGIKITDFCDENKVSTADRLKLFIQVCQAIQHAHQKGIIHRDIKPSNILVTINDGVPVPKVIDFGIAKATQGRLTDKTVFTAFHQFLGTPAYMSPEQAVMTSLDIDTRSDIYSLGVLLYELLTGRPPFDQQELFAAGLDEMRRTICEQEPPKPSTRLTQELTSKSEIRPAATARQRGENLKSEIDQASSPRRLQELIKLVRGDLDWIVMKALEKDRTRRYETANGFATDLQRHLNNEPVVARPPSAAYRFQKLVRRNKIAVAATGAVAAALIIGLGASTWLFLREKAEAAKSQQVAQFLARTLGDADPSIALSQDNQMLRNLLDKTAVRVGRDLSNQPEVAAELRNTLGSAYRKMGLFQKSEAMYREALAIRPKLRGNKNLEAISLQGLGDALKVQGKVDEAGNSYGEAAALYRQAAEQGHAVAQNNLGFMYEHGQGVPQDAAEAVKWYRKAAEQGNAFAQINLGITYRHGKGVAKDAVEAVKWYRKAAEQGSAVAQSSLGSIYYEGDGVAKDAAEAVKWFLQAAEQGSALAKHNLGVMYRGGEGMAKDAAEAATWFLQAAEQGYADSQNNLGSMYADGEGVAKDFTEAVKWYQKAAEQGNAVGQNNLALMYAHGEGVTKDLVEAGKWNRKAAEQGDAYAQNAIGVTYARGEGVAKDAAEAVKWYRKAAARGHAVAQNNLGSMYAEGEGVTEDLAEAAKWYRKAAEQNNPDAQSNLGRMYAHGEGVAKDLPEAVKWLRKAAEQGTAVAQNNLGAMYADGEGVAKDFTEAAKWYRKAAEQGNPVAQNNLGAIYARGEGAAKDLVEAVKWHRKAADQGAPDGLNGLAWLLATCPDAKFRDGPAAVTFAEKAVAATKRKDAGMLDTLAAAYAEAGEFAKAVSIQKEAMALLHDEQGKKDLASRLKLYESNTPYREP